MIKEIFSKIFSKGDAMSFKEALDLAGLPVVTFYQGKRKINFLLDTGSNNCVIDSGFLGNIEHTMFKEQTDIYGMEGCSARASICQITMSYKDRDYTYPYVIKDMGAAFSSIKRDTGVTIHGILGSRFFEEFRYVLDFKELIAYSRG